MPQQLQDMVDAKLDIENDREGLKKESTFRNIYKYKKYTKILAHKS